MVGVVSGNGLGVLTNSGAILGRDDNIGTGQYGVTGEKILVNAKTGNLIIQGLDEFVPSNGNAGISVLRTYNSQGKLDDDNGDNWKLGLSRKLLVSGNVSLPSNVTVTRIDGDDSRAVYTYAGTVSGTSLSRYTSSDGAGGMDAITWNPATSTWGWSDGDSYEFENYDINGRLNVSRGMYYAYNSDGMLASVKDNTGGGTFFTYDSTKSKNLIGVLVSYPLVVVNGAPGPQTALKRISYAYDAQDRLSEVRTDLTPKDGSISDANYYWTRYSYEDNSRLVATITQKDGAMLTITYKDNRVHSVTDNMSETEIFDYSVENRTDVLNVRDNSVTSFERNAAGQLSSVTKRPASGPVEVNSYKYDTRGNVIEITDADGDVTTKQYDANDNCIFERNPAGDVIKRTFDANNRKSPLTETVYMATTMVNGVEQYLSPATTRYIYDHSGENVRYVIGPENNVTEYRYNNLGQRTHSIAYTDLKESVPAVALSGDYRKLLLDKMAALTYPQRKNVIVTGFTFNPHGQVATASTFARLNEDGSGVFDGSESTVQYTYDHSGKLLQQIDALGNQTSFVYDGLGRVLTAVAPATTGSGTTKTVYNGTPAWRTVGGLGMMTTQSIVTYADGHRLVTNSDVLGRVVSSEVQDAAQAPMSTTLYGYDSAGRLNLVQDPAGVRSYIFYDAAGRKGLTVDGDGSAVRYKYSAAGDLTLTTSYAKAVDVAAFTNGQSIAQLRAENLVVSPDPADRNEWRAYDKAGRLSRTVDQAGYVVEFKYDRASRLERTIAYANPINPGSGDSASLAMPAASADDRVKTIQHLLTGAVSGVVDALGATIYERDQTGKKTGIWQNGSLNHDTASYNQKGLLSSETDADGYITQYEYDKNDNVVRKTRFATAGSTNPSGSQAWTYEYLAGKLTRETGPDGTVTVHVYDAMGARISSTAAYNTSEARSSTVRRDAMGRVTAELSAEGTAKLSSNISALEVALIWIQHATKYTYDSAGRRTSMTDQLGNKTVYYYDKDGRLAATINGEGDVEYREYSMFNELSKVTRFATQMSKSGLPSMVGGELTQAIRSTITSRADGAHDLVRLYDYNNLGKVAVESVGESTDQFGYNAFGEVNTRRQSMGDGTDATSAMTYDIRGNLKTRTTFSYHGPAMVEKYDYDALNRQVSRSIGGIVTTTEYDRRGNATLMDDAMTDGVRRQHDAFGRLRLETSALGYNTTYEYVTGERKVTITTAEGVITTIVNNLHGERHSVTVGNTTTTYGYDRSGKLASVSDALGSSQSTHYDAASRADVLTDGNGVETRISYDAAGRVLTSIVDPGGLNLTTRYSYNGIGQVLSVTDPAGVVRQSQYDNRGNVIALTTDATGLNLTTRYTYDDFGRTTKVTDANGAVTTFAYDEMGRRLSETSDNGEYTTSFAYDEAGNVRMRTDANGHVTHFYYDLNNRMSSQVDANGSVTAYVYDGNNRVVRTRTFVEPVDPELLPVVLQPTATDPVLGLIEDYDDNLDRVMHNVYDKDGRLRFTIDGTGAVVEHAYNDKNQVYITVAYAKRVTPQVAHGLEGMLKELPELIKGENYAVTHKRYDARGRISETMNGIGGVTRYEYDGNGLVTSITGYAHQGMPATSRQRMSYDGAGRMTFSARAQAVDANGNATAWSVTQQQYDKAGNVVGRTAYATPLTAAAPAEGASSAVVAQWLAGVAIDPARDQQERHVYDGGNRQVASATAQHMKDGVLQWSVVAHAFDKVGNVVVRTAFADFRSSAALGSNPSQQDVAQWIGAGSPNPARDNISRMVYDAGNRLRFAVDGMGAVSENRYDGNGNVLWQRKYNGTVSVSAAPVTEAALASALDEPDDVASARVTEYTYDGAGRVRTIDDHHGPKQQRIYDALGHMLETRQGERIERFAYDTDGRLRFSIDAGGYVKETVYDGLGRLSRKVQYFTPLGDMTDLFLRDPEEVRGNLTVNAEKDRTTVYEYDIMGNMVSSTDAMGVTERFEYDALGRKTAFINGMNNRWTYDYDAAGRLKIEHSPEVLVSADDTSETLQSMVTIIDYDAFGNVRQRTEAAGSGASERVTKYEYDLAGRQVKTTLPVVPVYNAAGETYAVVGIDRMETTPSVGASTTVVYDAAGRAIKNIDALGNVTQKVYSARGDLLFDIDALGQVTGYEHDAHGNVTRVTRYADSIAATSAQRQVVELFVVLAGRAPDAGELRDWSAKFRAGASYAEIARQLLTGPLANTLYPAAGEDLDAFVAQVFKQAFGRNATDAEFASWRAMAGAPGVTHGAFIDTVLHQIAGAAELRAWNAKLDAVLPARADLPQQVALTELYAALLDRSPTPAELASGLVLLREGMSRLDFANKLLGSTEGSMRYPASADETSFVNALSQAMLHHAPGGELIDLAYLVSQKSRADAVLAMIARMGDSQTSDTDRTMFAARVAANLGLAPVTAPVIGAVDPASLRAALARSDAASNRVIEMSYDFRNKVLTTLEGKGQFYQSVIEENETKAFEGRRFTTNRYNAFGELVEQRVSASVDPAAPLTEATIAAVTRYDYNKLGQKIGEVVFAAPYENGGGGLNHYHETVSGVYVTQSKYDFAGNVSSVTEYATAIYANDWMRRTDWADGSIVADGSAADWRENIYARLVPEPGHLAEPGKKDPSDKDRITKYYYDAANRKMEQWELNVAGTPVEQPSQNVRTIYRYDEVGNLTETENAYGGITRSNYDALGRVSSVTGSAGFDALAFNGIALGEDAGELRYTLTAFKRDIHGNVLRSIAYADGSATLIPAALAPVGAEDRVTYTRYDRNGHAIQVVDADGKASFASYDALGRLARQWQSVTRLNSGKGADEASNTVFKIYHYDALGRVDGIVSPGTTTSVKTDNPLRLTRQSSSTGYSSDATGKETWTGINEIVLSYLPLPPGEVRVEVKYKNANGDKDATRTVTGSATSATIRWEDKKALAGGLGTVLSAVVSVKGADGVWKQVYAATTDALEVKMVNDGAASSADIKRETTDYNSFGEVVQRSVDGVAYEYSQYDSNGRAWRTNAGDGIDKIMVYNVTGQATLQLRSAATGAGSAADASYKSIKNVKLDSATFERTEMEYDLMGRLLVRMTPGSAPDTAVSSEPAKIVAPRINNVHVSMGSTEWYNSPAKWMGTNVVQVDFSVPADLGASDIMVRIKYTNVRGASLPLEDWQTVPPPSNEPPAAQHTYQQVFDASQLKVDHNGHWIAKLAWDGQAAVKNAAFDSVELFKKDVNGLWQLVANAEDVRNNYELGKPEKPLGPFMKVPAEVIAYAQYDNGQFVDLRTLIFNGATLVDLSNLASEKVTVLTFLRPAEGQYTYSRPYNSSEVTMSGTPGADRHAAIGKQERIHVGDTVPRIMMQQSDRWGNVVLVTDPRDFDQVVSYTYNARNQRTGEEVSRKFFDDNDSISTEVYSSRATYYDMLGRQVATWKGVDEKDVGTGTDWAYDVQGNLSYQRNELGIATRSKYNLFGERTQLIQSMSEDRTVVTNYGYDKLGRVERSWMDHIPVVKITGITHGNGMNVELVGADQTLTQYFRYDELGRRIASTNSAGGQTRTRYDLDGNVVSTTDESGVIMRYAYDSMHRKIFEQDAMGKKNTWHYEGGILKRSTDMGGTTTLYGYDGLRHMWYQKGVAKSTGQTPEPVKDLMYIYDGAGLLTRVEDRALNQVTTYAYDQAGNRVREKTVMTEVLQAVPGATFSQTSDSVRIAGIYMVVFGRTADLGELSAWENKLILDDATFPNIAEQLLKTAEGQARFGSGLSNADFITTLYQLTFGTTPDAESLAVLTGRLEQGESGGQIVVDVLMAMSGDAKAKLDYFVHMGMNPTLSSTVKHQVAVQDNYITYDRFNRMTRVTDGRYNVAFAYDNNGNRIKVDTTYTNAKGEVITTHEYNKYDALNRQLIVNGENLGTDANPNIVIGKRGHELKYDDLGNRISDTYLLNPEKTDSQVVDSYEYDNAGRLSIARRGSWIIDKRSYDSAGRLAHAGVFVDYGGTEPAEQQAYRAALKEWNLDAGTRSLTYDEAGRILRQKEFRLDGSPGNDIKYMLGAGDSHSSQVGYDAAGHLKGYYVVPPGSKPSGQFLYTSQYTYFDGYRQSGLTVMYGDGGASRTTVSTYDVNGFLVKVTVPPEDDTKEEKIRLFVNDVSGHILRATADEKVTHSLVVNDQMLGATGGTLTDVGPGIFGSTYEPASSVAAANVPFVYIVQQEGETLQGIAQSIWGDSKLWYLIADANGVSDAQIKPGLALQVPARVNTVHNDYQTFKPYNPSALVGDNTPTLPPPAAKEGCGPIGTIVTVVLFAVLSIVAPFGVGFWASAAYGAIASTVGQAVAVAADEQEEISWKNVALSAVAAGIAAGVQVPGVSNPIIQGAAKAAVANAMTQGVAVAFNMQEGFSWQAIAGAAVGGAVAQGINGIDVGADKLALAGRGFAANFAGGMASSAVRGGHTNARAIAWDAFGNALGNTLGSNLAERLDPDPLGTFIDRNNKSWANISASSENLYMGKSFGKTYTEDELSNARGRTIANRYADDYGMDIEDVRYLSRREMREIHSHTNDFLASASGDETYEKIIAKNLKLTGRYGGSVTSDEVYARATGLLVMAATYNVDANARSFIDRSLSSFDEGLRQEYFGAKSYLAGLAKDLKTTFEEDGITAKFFNSYRGDDKKPLFVENYRANPTYYDAIFGVNETIGDRIKASGPSLITMAVGVAALQGRTAFNNYSDKIARSIPTMPIDGIDYERGVRSNNSVGGAIRDVLTRESQRSGRAFYNGAPVDPIAAVINPELAEDFVGPVNPANIFRRIVSPSQSAADVDVIKSSGELWGNANYTRGGGGNGIGTPTVSAMRGYLEPMQEGFEFITTVGLGNSQSPKLNGQVNWGRNINGELAPGMKAFVNPKTNEEAISIPIVILRVKKGS